MSDQPSYKTSTLSQAFIFSLGFYALVIILVTIGLIWGGLNVEVAKLVMGWVSALQAVIMSS